MSSNSMSSKQTHDQLLPLASVCADDAEVLAISVARFIAAGYMTGDAACWDAAHHGAERLLGPLEGPRFVGSIAGLMRAIRVERAADWRFLPATCCRVTNDERGLVALIALGRRGPPDAVRHAAAKLAGTTDAPRVTAMASAVAALLDQVQPVLKTAQPDNAYGRAARRADRAGVLH